MGVDYYVCAAKGCQQVVNDCSDRYLDITESDGKTSRGGCICRGCIDEITETCLPVLKNCRIIIKFECKRPSVSNLSSSFEPNFYFCKELLEIIIDYYSSKLDFLRFNGINCLGYIQILRTSYGAIRAAAIFIGEEKNDTKVVDEILTEYNDNNNNDDDDNDNSFSIENKKNKINEKIWNALYSDRENDDDCLLNLQDVSEFLDDFNLYLADLAPSNHDAWFEIPENPEKKHKRLKDEINTLTFSIKKLEKEVKELESNEDFLLHQWKNDNLTSIEENNHSKLSRKRKRDNNDDSVIENKEIDDEKNDE